MGRYIVLEDALGTRFTYAGLGSLATRRPVIRGPVPEPVLRPGTGRTVVKVRLFAHPARRGSRAAGGFEQLIVAGIPVRGYTTYRGRIAGPLSLHGAGVALRPLRLGSPVRAGTILGRVGRVNPDVAAHVRFAIRPAGARTPRLDPRPLLDGWRRLEAAGAFRPSGRSVLDAGVLGLAGASWSGLAGTVLADPRISIYPCGRDDIAAGRIDDRVLATLEILADQGLRPTVSSLQCGHSLFTAGGTISEHASGDAVDIAAINGIPILGHQGPGSITDLTVRRLLQLPGAMRPHQIISLMRFPGAGNTLALPDHDDHLHVGFRPPGAGATASRIPPPR